jgi:hypothetical protein
MLDHPHDSQRLTVLLVEVLDLSVADAVFASARAAHRQSPFHGPVRKTTGLLKLS